MSFQGRTYRIHRLAWWYFKGKEPEGVIDHLCHNKAFEAGKCFGGPTCIHRRCCNPAHLIDTSHRENTLRGNGPAAQKARKEFCIRGHPLSGDNLYLEPSYKYSGARRVCKECDRTKHLRRKEKAPG